MTRNPRPVASCALLSAAAWTHGIAERSRVVESCGRGVLGILLLAGAVFFFQVEGVIQPFPVALGLESRDHYLARQLNYFRAAQVVNQLPMGSLTVVVGDQRGYYYNSRVLVTPVFNKNPLADWSNEAASPDDLASRLASRGVTHLLINRSEMTRLDRVYHLFPFTPQGRLNWDGLVSRRARPIYHDRDCDVLAL